RSFSVRRPAPTPDAAGGAQALRDATDEALRQLIDWLAGLPASG
ncbi:MAG TPA: ABC transporter, partial [Ottowia sp.]|nr:ABC transporter [Ottowia sp.]